MNNRLKANIHTENIDKMIESFKKIFTCLEEINKTSKKKIISQNDFNDIKENIEDFEDTWKDFQTYLSKIQKIDPCNVEQFNSFIHESWMAMRDLDQLINDFDEISKIISDKYSPPCPDAEIEFNTWERNTPLDRAKLEAELEPLKHLKVKQEFFKHQEIYSLVPLSTNFLINMKHIGVKFLNNNLSLVNEINFSENHYEHINFDFWKTYKKFNSDEVIFADTQQKNIDILYINAQKNIYSILNKEQLESVELDKVYWWRDEELILHSQDIFYGVNPSTKKIRLITDHEIKKELPDFYNYVQESRNYTIIRAYPEQYIFIYKDIENLEVGIRNTKKNTTEKIKFYNEEIYDVKIHGDSIMFIEESRIDVRKGRHKRTLIFPDQEHFFINAQFLEKDNKLYVITLDESNYIGLSSSLTLYEIADSLKQLRAEE